MPERVTIQDIADALGISRNTVSKAINNSAGLASATRKKILRKAAEMGYKQFSYLNVMDPDETSISTEKRKDSKEIALFTTAFLAASHFATPLLDHFQREISQMGYSLTVHRISADELAALRLPLTFHPERTSAILCIEVFDYPYAQMLCELNMPILFVDAPPFSAGRPLRADQLLMNNTYGIMEFVHDMVRHGKREIGFIGDIDHCQSFYERYTAYRNAMVMYKGTFKEEYCITGNYTEPTNEDAIDHRIYLKQKLSALSKLPDAFICSNDFMAIDVIKVFKEMGIFVPEDVWLCGFDDSKESRVITPSLTTIHIDSQIMGLSAVQLLMSRMKDPSLSYRTVYTETNLIYRESTPF